MSGRDRRKDRVDRPGEPARLLVRPALRGVGDRARGRSGPPDRGRSRAEAARTGRFRRASAKSPSSGGMDRERAADPLARGPLEGRRGAGPWPMTCISFAARSRAGESVEYVVSRALTPPSPRRVLPIAVSAPHCARPAPASGALLTGGG